MSTKSKTHRSHEESELLGAALRYCAVADWFEGHPCRWHKHMTVDQAMAVFNEAEADLRAAGAKALRQHGHRALVLQAAGVAEEAR
jgi:hypothetical protein